MNNSNNIRKEKEKEQEQYDSDVTGSNKNGIQPVALIQASLTEIGKDYRQRLLKLEDVILDQQKVIINLHNRVKKIDEEIELPSALTFRSIGEASLSFEQKFLFEDTGISNWQNEDLLYISFGPRVIESDSYGGGTFIKTDKLLRCNPTEVGENAGTGKTSSIALGSLALQATYINCQVSIGRTERNSLLVATNNTNSGANPITLYAVEIKKKI